MTSGRLLYAHGPANTKGVIIQCRLCVGGTIRSAEEIEHRQHYDCMFDLRLIAF